VIDGSCSTYEREREEIMIRVIWSVKEGDHCGDIDLDDRLIVRYIFEDAVCDALDCVHLNHDSS